MKFWGRRSFRQGSRLQNGFVPVAGAGFALLLACAWSGSGMAPADLPSATELAGAPPAGSLPGNLEAVFLSEASIPGGGGLMCHKAIRFFADGEVLYADNACLSPGAPADQLEEILTWLDREAPLLSGGDYFLGGGRLTLRVVEVDPIHEASALRTFTGGVCGADLVLQEPAVIGFAGIPSALTQPVLDYRRLTAVSPAESADCTLAGFTIADRFTVAVAGGATSFRLQTRPGESCSLTYFPPESETAGFTRTITADQTGFCRWEWEVGAVPGMARFTVAVGLIRQDFALELK